MSDWAEECIRVLYPIELTSLSNYASFDLPSKSVLYPIELTSLSNCYGSDIKNSGVLHPIELTSLSNTWESSVHHDWVLHPIELTSLSNMSTGHANGDRGFTSYWINKSLKPQIWGSHRVALTANKVANS